MEKDERRQYLIQVFSQSMKVIARYGFTKAHVGAIKPGEYAILLYLEQEDKISPSHLSAMMGLQQATITPLIADLVQKNWITKNKSEYDHRMVELAITQEGQKQLEACKRNMFGQFSRLYDYLGEQDFETMTELLARASAFFLK